MRTVLFFLNILGTAAAIPTNARFLSDHPQPTTDSLSPIQQAQMLVTPDDTTMSILRVEEAENGTETAVYVEDHSNHKDEKPSAINSKEENHDQSADQDQSYSPELGLPNEEEKKSDLSENLEYTPTEGTLDLKENVNEPQEEKLPENIDFLAHDVSSTVDSDQQESITEENQEQPVNDSQSQLNGSSKYEQDLNDQRSPERTPNSPNEEEGEKGPGEFGAHNDNQERERELPKEHSSRKQEDSTQLDDIVEESTQPTQVSEMQKDEFEQDDQEQDDNSNEEMEEEITSKVKKHSQNIEWQSQGGKPGLEIVNNPEEIHKKTVSEALLMDPTDDGDDGPQHGARDNHFIAYLGDEKATSNYHHIKHEEQRESAHENVNAKKAESSANEDESSSEINMSVYSVGEHVDSCRNFQCKRGHMCKADQQGKPHCVCQDPVTCPPTKLLDQVCGTNNQTYASSCHLFATKCRLEGTKMGHQLQLDYFGPCKSIPACTDFEVTQFPLRMRDWLKNILMQLYESNPEHAGYLNEKQRNKVKKIYLDEKRLLAGDHSIDLLLRDFKKNYHMYVYPVHWQFSELDKHPMDRVLTHSELAPLRASLVPMEHCITRFFEECDPNKDKHITLKEWGHCFGIKEEDIDENLLF